MSKTWAAGPPILDAVDLDLYPGQIAALVGDNGIGKTTLLRILAGIISPDRGSVTIDGLDVRRDRGGYHRKVGFLAAGSAGLYARYSVRRHLDYWACLAFVPRRARRAMVASALERFDLGAIADQRADRLSMGQRQRLRLAMVFLHEPRLVLLDEPRNSLDPSGLEVLSDALAELRRRRGAGIWCAPTAERRGFSGRTRLPAVGRKTGVSTAVAYADAALAVAKRDFAVFRSYRLRFPAQILRAFVAVALFFYYISRLVTVAPFHEPEAYFGVPS